jgi:sulfite reductase alpha subunit-like flavoprotein
MIYVVYGSQTGNSEEISKRICREIKEKFISINVELQVMNKFLSSIQKFPEDKSNKRIIIAVCSTTGAGDPPNNADNFVRWIKRKTHLSDTLSNVYYTVLGLGDSNYTKYQYVPRLIDDCLNKIGASKFYQRGEADDAYGLENVVEPWIDGLYPKLEYIINEIEEAGGPKTNSNIEVGNISPSKIFDNQSIFKEFNEDSVFNGTVYAKTLLSGLRSEKEIYSLKINENIQRLSDYSPGSYISILPLESEERITKINSVIILKNNSDNSNFNILKIDKSNNFNHYSDFVEKFPHFNRILSKGYLTYDELVKMIIDFDSVLKKTHCENLRQLFKEKIQNSEVNAKYEILFSKYTEMILKNKITLYDIILSLFLSDIKLEMSMLDIIECFPIKYPRSYSLASYSYQKDENPLEIVFSVVNQRIVRKFPNLKMGALPLGIKSGEYYFKGQSSNYLKNIKEGDKLLICDTKNCFKFPLDAFLHNSKPVIYICMGTGITPCISFLKQILRLKHQINPSSVGQLIILTGFRSASIDRNETVYEDFINESLVEINQFFKKEVVLYHRSLSVMSENEEEEVGIWRNCRINTQYVQDLILEHDEKIFNIVFNLNGYIMICGDMDKLYDECINNIMTIIMKNEGYHREHSVKYIDDMKYNGRLIIEKWS